MRMCMIGHKYFPKCSIRQQRHFHFFIKRGIDIEVIALAQPGEKLRDIYMGAKVFRVNTQKVNEDNVRVKYWFTYLKSIFSIAALLLFQHIKKRYDVIYVFTLPDAMVFATLLPKLMGAKIIVDHLDPMPELYQTKYGFKETNISVLILKMIERFSLNLANQIITQNKDYAELLMARGIKKRKINIIHNTPDPCFWDPPVIPRRMDFSNHIVRFSFHGKITKRSGLHIAIEALSILREHNIDFMISLFRFGEYQNEVQRLIDNYNLNRHVEWYQPCMASEVPNLIRKADIGLVPNLPSSFAETNLPNRVFEYLWIGKPVIVSWTKGIYQYFSENSVFYFEAGDPKDCPRVISNVLKDKDIKKRVIRGQEICKCYSWDKEKAILSSILTKLV